METLKKIGLFFFLFIALMGMVSAPAALSVYHSWLPMIGSIIVDALAFKPFLRLADKLIR